MNLKKMTLKLFAAFQVGLIFLNIEQKAVSAEVLARCIPAQSPCVTMVEVALPVMLGTAVVAPFLAGFSNESPEMALASAVFNTFCLTMPLINAAVSWRMETQANNGSYSKGQTCGVVPIVSTLRNVLTMGLTIGATATSWLYHQNGNEQLYAVNTTLTTISSVMTIAGTSLMYCCLHPKFKEDNSYTDKRYGAI